MKAEHCMAVLSSMHACCAAPFGHPGSEAHLLSGVKWTHDALLVVQARMPGRMDSHIPPQQQQHGRAGKISRHMTRVAVSGARPEPIMR